MRFFHRHHYKVESIHYLTLTTVRTVLVCYCGSVKIQVTKNKSTK